MLEQYNQIWTRARKAKLYLSSNNFQRELVVAY